MPLVTVVVPAWRCVPTLGDCVGSVRSQTFRDWELIVVDDGSGDGTLAAARALAEEEPRMRVISQENAGPAAARAKGVAAGTGEWVAYLDADDAWLPQKLEAQLALAERTGAELLYTAAACMDGEGRPTGRIFPAPKETDYRRLLSGNVIVCSSVLVKRSWAERFPMENSALHEDYLCWLRMLQAGCRAAGVTEPLTRYRVSAGSKSGNKLRSAAMTWRTLRAAKVPFWRRCAAFCGYALHGLRRYH